MDAETFYDRILAAIVVPEGESASVAAPIGILAEIEEEIAEAKAKAMSQGATSAPPPPATYTPASAISQPEPKRESEASPSGPRKIVGTPYAKKLAKQHKVYINSVVGTGSFGRITPEDVEKAAGIAPSKNVVPSVAPPITAATATALPKPAAVAPPLLPGSTVLPFMTTQAAVSKNMVESLTVPTFHDGYPINTDTLDALYEKVKPKGVTMTALLAKAAAMALVQHPVVNASCKDGKNFSYNSNMQWCSGCGNPWWLDNACSSGCRQVGSAFVISKMERAFRESSI